MAPRVDGTPRRALVAARRLGHSGGARRSGPERSEAGRRLSEIAFQHGAATPAAIGGAYEHARQLQAAGEIEEAKRIYGQIVASVPHHAETLTMLGSIAYQQGDETQAEAYIDRAIQIYRGVLREMPRNLHVRAPLVNLLLARGHLAEGQALARDLLLPLNPIRSAPEEFVRRRQGGADRGLPLMLINSLPKSASESIWNQLAEGLQLAQSHLSIGLFPDCTLVPARVRSAAAGGLISKEHIPASAHNLAVLAEHGVDRVVVHLRDPRQAALSWAHFTRSDLAMRLLAPIWRKVMPPYARLQGDLSGLLDWCIAEYLPIQVDFIAGWKRVAEDPEVPVQVLFSTFEAFKTDPDDYFGRVLAFFEIPQDSFQAEADAETVHLRKGLKEEWREVFSAAQQAAAWAAIPGDLAAAFGWSR